jgi:hypothetical protein
MKGKMKNIFTVLIMFFLLTIFSKDFAQTSSIKMNEIYSRGTDSNPDWIELYNDSSDSVDISYYKIYDNGGESGTKPKKEFSSGTIIEPYGFYVVTTDGSDSSDFGLSNSGEEVWLEDSTGNIIDTVIFPALKSGESYGRIPDGSDTWETLTTQTKGYSNTTSTAVAENKSSVINYRLCQNYPNPFNPQTKITYSLKEKGLVQLYVYNLLGQLVKKLVNTQQEAGTYSVNFDGSKLSSGIYIYQLKVISLSGKANNFTASKKLILMK